MKVTISTFNKLHLLLIRAILLTHLFHSYVHCISMGFSTFMDITVKTGNWIKRDREWHRLKSHLAHSKPVSTLAGWATMPPFVIGSISLSVHLFTCVHVCAPCHTFAVCCRWAVQEEWLVRQASWALVQKTTQSGPTRSPQEVQTGQVSTLSPPLSLCVSFSFSLSFYFSHSPPLLYLPLSL